MDTTIQQEIIIVTKANCLQANTIYSIQEFLIMGHILLFHVCMWSKNVFLIVLPLKTISFYDKEEMGA